MSQPRRTACSRWSALVVLAAFVLLSAVASSNSASSSSVVSAVVPSATTLDASGCATGTPDVTDFGLVLPGASAVTTLDCVVEFGSSNDTSMLRMFQPDGGGDAMLPAPIGASLAMWTLNGSLEDESANANHGDPLPAAPNDPAYVAGGPGRGQALDFDGNDYATIPHHAAYNSASFTVDAWIRTPDSGAVIAARENSACGNGGLCQWELYLDPSGRIIFEIEVGGTWHGPASPAPINDDAWHHVAMTVDDATKEIRGYVDGQYIGADTTWGAGSADTGTIPIVLGRNGDGIDWYTGEVDEIRHQSGVRTAADIRRYHQGRIQDYADGSQDWDTPIATTSMFGVCLESVATGAATDGTTFVPNPGCPTTDGVGWRSLPPTTGDPDAKVATSPLGDDDAAALLRFGFRPSSSQPAGGYEAPVAFEVVAPAA